MGIYTISDLHLSFSADKPMDVFGGKWENYTEKLKRNWNDIVTDKDIVVLPGDLSWATYLEDSMLDFSFIHSLNGRKIIMEENHDYWFSTAAKINAFFEKNGLASLCLLHNNFYIFCDESGKRYGICGTKGFDVSKNPTKGSDLKLLNRESMRLAYSVTQAEKAGCDENLVFLHYPPVFTNGKFNRNPFTEVMQQHGIKKCFYGHLHNTAAQRAVNGEYEGIEYKLVSCDHLNFVPYRIL